MRLLHRQLSPAIRISILCRPRVHRQLFSRAPAHNLAPSQYQQQRQQQQKSSKPFPPPRYNPSLPESLAPAYSEDFLRYYERHVRGTTRYRLPKLADTEYPSSKDPPQYKQSAHRLVTCRDVELPRKTTGNILLRIYESTAITSNSPVVIYLPSRGTTFTRSNSEHSVVSHLAHLTNATVISIGYRIHRPFPTSLHDALAAIDWIRANIPTVNLEKYKAGFSGRLMAVLGTGIGGSLAASIGITEGRESGIIAVGAWMPVVDWAFDPLPGIPESHLSTLPKSPDRLRTFLRQYGENRAIDELPQDFLDQLGVHPPDYDDLADNPFLNIRDLRWLRSRYIVRAEDYTDPFVSPLYWFKSSGVNIWTSVISMMNDARYSDPYNLPKWVDNLPDEVFKRGGRKKKSYPPLHLLGQLTVPMMRVVAGDGDVLRKQTEEFVHAARAAIFPRKQKSLEELEEEEEKELEQRYQGDPAEGLFLRFDSPPTENEFLEYNEVAQSYFSYKVLKRAGHCLITGAEEIEAGMEEVKAMANWLRSAFDFEPKRLQIERGQEPERTENSTAQGSARNDFVKQPVQGMGAVDVSGDTWEDVTEDFSDHITRAPPKSIESSNGTWGSWGSKWP